MASMSISGVVSGMDWESMIDEIITAAAKPAQVQVNKKTNLQNKKSLFEEMKVMVQSIQSSMTSLKLPSTYKAKAVDIERVDNSGSYKGVLNATVNADAAVNVYDIVVQQLATAQTNRSKQITASSIASTLASGGVSSKNSKMYITAGGQKIGIDVYSTDSLQSLKSRINTTIKTLDNPLDITASVVDNRLIIKSDSTGKGTKTVEGTVKGGYNSNGLSSLKGVITNADSGASIDIAIPDDEESLDRLSVRSGSTTYTRGTDYVVVNGTEIRWRQYDESTHVALEDDVNVKYTMAAGDTYTASGTYGTSEAEISGFTMTDNGTLASRLSITDAYGKTYAYGTDFTIKDNKVEWLKTETVSGVPKTYTVSLKKTEATQAEFSGTNFKIPEGFTLSCGEPRTTSFTVSLDGNISTILSPTTLSDLTDMGLPVYSAGTQKCIDAYDRAGVSITLDTTDGESYEYGENFVIRGPENETQAYISWSTGNSALASYVTDYKSEITHSQPSTLPTGSTTFNISYTPTYDSTVEEGKYCDTLASVIEAANGDYSKLTLTDKNGNSYTYGTDYTIDSEGNIQWAEEGSSISTEDFENIEEVYKAKYNTSIPTVTITGSDGVLRTYLDPKDTSLFTMKSSSMTEDDEGYVYGRDYVIRVKDDGQGYMFSWLVTGDSNNDGRTDIKDANIAVSAYTAKKGLSTSGWKKAPSLSEGETYSFSFSDETTITHTAELTPSTTSTNLASALGLDSLTAEDIAGIEITSGGTTYTAGEDYTIDADGNITWNYTPIAKPAENATYTVDYSGSATYYTQNIAFDDTSRLVKITLDDGDYMSHAEATAGTGTFTIKDSAGQEYEYGTDFTFTQSTELNSEGQPIFSVNWLTDAPEEGSYRVYYTTTRTGSKSGITLSSTLANPVLYKSEDITYTGSEETAQTAKITIADDDLMSYAEAYAIAAADSSAFYITDSKGTRYSYGTHFTFAQSTEKNAAGEYIMDVIWVDDDTKPAEGRTYNVHYSDDSVSRDLTLNSAFSVYSLSKTSNLPEDAVISITDSAGNTYTYGNEFTLESDGSIHWYADDSQEHPSGSYTLTYKSFSALEASDSALSVDADDSTLINVSSFSGVSLAYSNILSDLKLTQGKTEDDSDFAERVQDAFSEAFVLTNTDTSTDYVYGTDYKIIGSAVDEDAVSMPVIKWLSGTAPSDMSKLTLTYTGRGEGGGEVISTTVKRSATDSVMGGTDSSGNSISPTYSKLSGGTTTITLGAKTFYEHIDFTIEEGSDGMANIRWIPDSEGGYEWYYPVSGSSYTVNHTDTDGNETTFYGYRSGRTVLNMADLGIASANGSLSVQYGDGTSLKLDADYSDFDEEDGTTYTANDAIRAAYSFTVDKTSLFSEAGNVDGYYFNWYSGARTARSNMPSYGDEISIEYEYDANEFSLSDNGDGLLEALGLTDEENITEAHNAIILLDGNEVQRDSNDIGEAYGNEISSLKGVTLNLKGLGEVSLDVYHDAEKAVEAITTFTESYNDLMTWMNTRMSESAVDDDTAATIDSDDFRMRWGLLHGNALLRQTKSTMRNLTAQAFNYSFTQRDSNEEVYGTMSNNGLKSEATLRLRISGVYSDLTILPTDTLQDIVDKINDRTNPEMRNMYYGTDGKELEQPRVKASINDDKLVLSSTDSEAITISGTSAMRALKLNYTYTGLFQLGIATTSTDYGKSGELEFDESTFMEALEENADEVQELMLMYANQMDTWLKSMLTSSASGETSGTLTRQIEDIDTQIASIDEYLEKYQDRLDRQEEALRTKFAAAEQTISDLSQQASSIAAILNQLNGYTSSSSSSDS